MAKAALGGFRNEDWVVAEFNNWHCGYWARDWLQTMGHDPDKIEHLCAQTTRKMGYMNKADVLVLVEDQVEWVSVKKFTASFNQIDKRWTDRYAEEWKMPQNVVEVFKKYCGEEEYRPIDLHDKTADNRRYKMNEMSEEERKIALEFLTENQKKIAKSVISGSGKASAKWMLIVEEKDDSPYRSAMIPINQVIAFCTGECSITEQGNLRLGRLTIQRKGGDGGRNTAQMLQFKFSPRDLFNMQGVRLTKRPARAL